MININGGTETVCLIGNPVAHSFSPYIHNYGFGLHNINAVYLAHQVKDEELEDAVKGLKAFNYLGCNVTYPHKTKIIPMLDDLTEEARLIGAVNTIKNEDGKLVGYNTDGIGFIEGLKNKGFNLDNKNICILGAGGAARSIIISLLKEYECNITICNRDVGRALSICESLFRKKEFKGKVTSCITPDLLKAEHKYNVIINCTPVGMSPDEDSIPFEEELHINKNMLVCDLVYKPYETKLLQRAKEAGSQIHYGLDMLIFQAIVAFKIWTGKDIPYKDIEKLLKNNIY